MGEYAIVNDYNVMPIPKTVSDVQGAMIEPATVALYGFDRGGVTAGSSVLISGAGPIGALTILAARAAGLKSLASGGAKRAAVGAAGATGLPNPVLAE